MKKNLMLCALLLAVLLSGCAAEPLQGQTAGNTPKAPTPQEETPAFFEPVSTDSSAPATAPTEAADPAACIPNEDKHDSSPSFSSEPVSAPTESNAPTPKEDRQAPVLPEKPEKAESPKEEPSVPAITEPEPTPEPAPTPEPTPEPSPVPTPEPRPDPVHVPSPDPTPPPEPLPMPGPVPDPKPLPLPPPVPEPLLAPMPLPSPEPMPVPLPEPMPVPVPVPIPPVCAASMPVFLVRPYCAASRAATSRLWLATIVSVSGALAGLRGAWARASFLAAACGRRAAAYVASSG